MDMNGHKNIVVILGLVFSLSLIASSVSVILVSSHCSRSQLHLLNAVCSEVFKQEPEMKKTISAILKQYRNGNMDGTEEDVLSLLGYHTSDFSGLTYRQIAFFALAGFLAGAFLFIWTFLYRNIIETKRIHALADYLDRVNTGKAEILYASGEDDFSKLEDGIYKTVAYLYQTKDAAVQAKNNFADNLLNIAHQLKTPITAIFLSLQIMQDGYKKTQLEQIQKQLLRLNRLEESLLVLSRFDAGTLVFEREEVDVFTVLVLAADHLQELLAGSDTFIDIPELGEMAITVDLDWTMEAFINLMKNCMEHNQGGTIHCSYEQNPLYTQILVWDEGDGFIKEDIPHLFERFYRGANACEGGIGIGLALAKEIIERQNGTIRAKNRSGGACFEIRFYSH